MSIKYFDYKPINYCEHMAMKWCCFERYIKALPKHRPANINASNFLLVCCYGTGGDANDRDVIRGSFWLP